MPPPYIWGCSKRPIVGRVKKQKDVAHLPLSRQNFQPIDLSSHFLTILLKHWLLLVSIGILRLISSRVHMHLKKCESGKCRNLKDVGIWYPERWIYSKSLIKSDILRGRDRSTHSSLVNSTKIGHCILFNLARYLILNIDIDF